MTLHCNTLRCMSLHCTTLHYISFIRRYIHAYMHTCMHTCIPPDIQTARQTCRQTYIYIHIHTLHTTVHTAHMVHRVQTVWIHNFYITIPLYHYSTTILYDTQPFFLRLLDAFTVLSCCLVKHKRDRKKSSLI